MVDRDPYPLALTCRKDNAAPGNARSLSPSSSVCLEMARQGEFRSTERARAQAKLGQAKRAHSLVEAAAATPKKEETTKTTHNLLELALARAECCAEKSSSSDDDDDDDELAGP